MIVIADLWMYDKNHVPFNAAMIKILKNIFPAEEKWLFCEKRHFNNISKFEEKIVEGISYNEVYQIKGGKLKHFIREIIAFVYLLKVLFFCFKNKSDLLIMLYMYPPVQYVFQWIKTMFFPKMKVVVVLHGELSWVLGNRVLHKKLCGFLLKAALERYTNKNIKFIILGEVIKKNLLLYCKINEEQLICIDHPYIYTDIQSNNVDFSHMHLATIGTADAIRNTQMIFELGLLCKEFIKKRILELEIIGGISPTIHSYINKYVKFLNSNEKLSRHEYEQKINNSDYILFFRDNSEYTMRASGAFFDAIQFEKPIIALKNDFFDYYFERFGNIGYLYKDINELEEIVNNLLNEKPVGIYKEQLNNIRQAKRILSINQIEKNLAESLRG